MAKKDTKKTNEENNSENKKDIVIEETEADVALGTEFIGDSEDLKKAVKRDSEKGRIMRVLVPIIFFTIIAGIIGYATWYYTRPEGVDEKTLEEKIQTPPVVTNDKEETPNEETETKKEETTETITKEEPTTNYIIYVVKSGDTLSGIANEHGLTSKQLADYNGIADVNSLQIGQTIKIPQ